MRSWTVGTTISSVLLVCWYRSRTSMVPLVEAPQSQALSDDQKACGKFPGLSFVGKPGPHQLLICPRVPVFWDSQPLLFQWWSSQYIFYWITLFGWSPHGCTAISKCRGSCLLSYTLHMPHWIMTLHVESELNYVQVFCSKRSDRRLNSLSVSIPSSLCFLCSGLLTTILTFILYLESTYNIQTFWASACFWLQNDHIHGSIQDGSSTRRSVKMISVQFPNLCFYNSYEHEVEMMPWKQILFASCPASQKMKNCIFFELSGGGWGNLSISIS